MRSGLSSWLRRRSVVYPLFLAKVLCFCLFACAFNLLLGSVGLLSLGHARLLRIGGLCDRPRAQGMGTAVRTRGAGEVPVRVRCSACMFGYVSIRRSGLYFAMITLALGQMIYFLAFQLPFTHAEDGLTAVPRGKLLGMFDLNNNFILYLRRRFHLPRRLPADLPHYPFDLRSDPQGDPRERSRA